jgi:cyclophilin family peptidyl-prolyl cis-trans isomerase
MSDQNSSPKRRRGFALLALSSIVVVAGLTFAFEPKVFHWLRNQIDPTYQIPAEYQTLEDNDSPLKPRSNPNPDLTVDETGLSKAIAVVRTNKGIFRFRFYSLEAPNTVRRLVELVSEGFYDGLTFHRVEPDFVVQGGDPSGTGTGGSGQKLKAEFNEVPHVKGTLGMARSADPDSADSQFYIALKELPHLDGNQTVFGLVFEGLDIVEGLEVGDRIEQIFIE